MVGAVSRIAGVIGVSVLLVIAALLGVIGVVLVSLTTTTCRILNEKELLVSIGFIQNYTHTQTHTH